MPIPLHLDEPGGANMRGYPLRGVGALHVGGKALPAYTLEVTGTGHVSGAATLGSTLDVTGAVTMASTLSVTGAADAERLAIDVLTAAPATPANGMIVYADGTTWNPGSGEGFYGYQAGAWVKL